MRTVSIIIPDHIEAEMEELCAHYAVPMDFLAQKFVIDSIAEVYEERILEHRAKSMRGDR